MEAAKARARTRAEKRVNRNLQAALDELKAAEEAAERAEAEAEATAAARAAEAEAAKAAAEMAAAEKAKAVAKAREAAEASTRGMFTNKSSKVRKLRRNRNAAPAVSQRRFDCFFLWLFFSFFFDKGGRLRSLVLLAFFFCSEIALLTDVAPRRCAHR